MMTNPPTGSIDWLNELVRIDYHPGAENINPPMACQTTTFEKDGKEIIYRGCQLVSGKDSTCNKIEVMTNRNPDVTFKGCTECGEDGCNKSSQIGISSILVITTLLIVKTFY